MIVTLYSRPDCHLCDEAREQLAEFDDIELRELDIDADEELLSAYLAILLAHREVVPLITTDVAVLNHPNIGPRLRAQNQQLQSLLTAPNTDVAARLRAEAALGAIWPP